MNEPIVCRYSIICHYTITPTHRTTPFFTLKWLSIWALAPYSPKTFVNTLTQMEFISLAGPLPESYVNIRSNTAALFVIVYTCISSVSSSSTHYFVTKIIYVSQLILLLSAGVCLTVVFLADSTFLANDKTIVRTLPKFSSYIAFAIVTYCNNVHNRRALHLINCSIIVTLVFLFSSCILCPLLLCLFMSS